MDFALLVIVSQQEDSVPELGSNSASTRIAITALVFMLAFAKDPGGWTESRNSVVPALLAAFLRRHVSNSAWLF